VKGYLHLEQGQVDVQGPKTPTEAPSYRSRKGRDTAREQLTSTEQTSTPKTSTQSSSETYTTTLHWEGEGKAEESIKAAAEPRISEHVNNKRKKRKQDCSVFFPDSA
jgi:hypothetical protein